MSARPIALALAALVAPDVGAQEPAAAPKQGPRLAFVTNCVADFWTIATFGVDAAAKASGAQVSVHMPPNGTAEEQKRILEDALARGVQGIAVSPKDPENMTALLNRVAGRALLITHDSDAPKSKRLCYVGMDNYDAGRLCGQLVEEALPQGGAIVVLVGTLDQDNARRRRQGLIDQLLDRSHDSSRFDAQDAVLKGDRFEIRATYTDQFDRPRCKAIAQDALGRWNDVACMVGLFEYEPPLLLEAVESARRLGKVKVVAFDENEATLQGILDGHVHGTVVQNPYEYGRASVELLTRLLAEPDPQKRAALLPKDGFLSIPGRAIKKDDVAAFWSDLRQKTGKVPVPDKPGQDKAGPAKAEPGRK
jgi:ribose transport system substrate-binding protein